MRSRIRALAGAVFRRVRWIPGTGGAPVETFFLLMETGDDLLLESGDKILLESAP